MPRRARSFGPVTTQRPKRSNRAAVSPNIDQAPIRCELQQPHEGATEDEPQTFHQALASFFVNHANFSVALREVNFAISEGVARKNPPGIHVSGGTGAGKTVLGERLEILNPRITDGSLVYIPGHLNAIADHIPLVRIDIGDQPTVISVATLLLEAFGEPKPIKGTKQSLTDRVDRYTTSCGTVAYVIDEAQRILDRSGTVVGEDIINWLNDRRRRHRVTLVFLGLGRLRYLFDKDEQLDRRFNNEIRIEDYRWWTKDGRDCQSEQDNFAGTMTSLIRKCNIDLELDLDKDLDLYRFYYVGSGRFGYDMKLFDRVADQHKMNGRTDRRVSMKDLRDAYKFAFRDGGVNPFTTEFSMKDIPPVRGDDTVLLPSNKVRRQRKSKYLTRRELSDALTKR